MSQNGSNQVPRAVHYSQLPPANPDEPLGQEWNTYREQVEQLLSRGLAGKHVLIKGAEIIGIFDTHEAAYQAGVQCFLRDPFLVHEIREAEPDLRIRGVSFPWANSVSR